MGESDQDKKISIPEWQSKSITSSESTTAAEQHSQSSDPDKATLDIARQFLDDDSIRHEPREHKFAFLEKKGLTTNVIQKLLAPETEADATADPLQEPQLKTVHDSTTSAPKQQQQPIFTSTQSTSSPPPTRDIPPVITYPEFLVRPQKPPPLVTVQRLVYATYGFAGLAALTYGASKFLVQPMLDALTAARQELAAAALQDLEKLNSKLEASVSHVPYMSSNPPLNRKNHGEYGDEDAESIDSDPTELFHRDIATQTSPNRSRSSSTSTDLVQLSSLQNPTSRQSSSLKSLLDNLASLKSSNSSTKTTSESLRETMSDFQTYLNTLQFSGNSYRTEYSSIYTAATNMDSKKISKAPSDTDEAAKLKAEIRALKGVFLSSRNFPPGRPMVGTSTAGMKG